MKKKYGMSNFWKNVISMSILLFTIWLAWFSPMYKGSEYYNLSVGLIFLRMLIILLTLFQLLTLHVKLDISLNYKYRIIKKDDWFKIKKYEPQVLKSWFWFLIWWQPVSISSKSYDSQNIFGAKTTKYYSTTDTFDSIEDATESIEEYKIKAKRQLKKFFERPEKEQIIKIKV